MSKLINITQLAILLKIVDPKTNKPLAHVLRYWEKEFVQIKPSMINNRRYYSHKQVETIRLIKFLLKDKGMTIKGAKILLKNKINTLDDNDLYGLQTEYHKNIIKTKSKKILEKLKKIKNYGKKNSYKS